MQQFQLKKTKQCKILIQGLLTLAILAILVACSDGVHAVAGGTVGRGAV